MTPFQLANTIEAAIWPSIGITLAFIGRKKGMPPKEVLLTTATLFAFGASDLVEAQTGAWYKPWWLFLWKATCVLILLTVLLRAAKRQKTRI